jgi:hypothetical protein
MLEWKDEKIMCIVTCKDSFATGNSIALKTRIDPLFGVDRSPNIIQKASSTRASIWSSMCVLSPRSIALKNADIHRSLGRTVGRRQSIYIGMCIASYHLQELCRSYRNPPLMIEYRIWIALESAERSRLVVVLMLAVVREAGTWTRAATS